MSLEKEDQLNLGDIKKTLSKVAYYFPGQNAGVDGMESLFSSRNTSFGRALEQAKSILGEEIEKPWFKPVILVAVTVGMAVTLTRLLERRPQTHVALSMGELSSAVSSGAIDLRSALLAMKARQEELLKLPAEPRTGLMTIIGLSKEVVENGIVKARNAGVNVEYANWNSPKQSIVGGPIGNLLSLKDYFEKSKHILIGGIGWAIHTGFVKEAADGFRDRLPQIILPNSVNDPVGTILSPIREAQGLNPVVKNREGIYRIVSDLLDSQVHHKPVLEGLSTQGVNTLVIFDPSRRIVGMVEDCVGPEVEILCVSDRPSLESVASALTIKYDLPDGEI